MTTTNETTRRLAMLTDDIRSEIGSDGKPSDRWWVAWAMTAYKMVEDLKPSMAPTRPADLPGDYELHLVLQTYRRKANPSREVKEHAHLFGEYLGALGRIEALNAGSLHCIATIVHTFERVDASGMKTYIDALRGFIERHYYGARLPGFDELSAPELHDWCVRACRRSDLLPDWLFYGRIPTNDERLSAKEGRDDD